MPEDGDGLPGGPSGAGPHGPTDPPRDGSAAPEPKHDDSGEQSDTTFSGAPPSDPAQQISEAGAAPGRAAETAGQMREARSDWHVNGTHDLVMGDKMVNVVTISGRRDTRIRLRELGEEELSLVLEAFSPPSGLDGVIQTVGRYPVTLVRGVRGSGRTATALHALLALEDTPSAIYRLDPATDLRDVSAGELTEKCALVLGDTESGRSFTVPRFELDRLALELNGHGCRLVVTVNESDPLPQYGFLVAAADVGCPPDSVTVIERHLQFRLGPGGEARVAQLMADPRMARLQQDHLGPGCTVEDAAIVARCIAEEEFGDVPGQLDVDRRMAARREAAYAEWFVGLPDTRTRCMAIAMAVLAGQPHETVSDAAEGLLGLLDPMSRERQTLTPPSPFGNPRKRELDLLNAMTDNVRQWTRHGELPVEVVRFAVEGFGRRLFLHVWEEYGDVRGCVLNWLHDLGRHPSAGVRARAATAVGVLSCRVFDHVYGKVLMPWATSKNQRFQESAATALGVPGRDPALRPVVFSLIEEWENDGRRTVRCTAARAYGASLGTERPGESLGSLAHLVEDQDVGLRAVVAQSLAELLAEEPDTFVDRVLDLLSDWVQNRKNRLDAAGRFAFLILAVDLETEAGEDGQRVAWPALLWLCIQNEHRLQQLAHLWWRVLNSTDLYLAAREVLGRWAERAEPSDEVGAELERLALAVARDPRTSSIVRRLATTWSGDDGTSPRTGARILASLPA